MRMLHWKTLCILRHNLHLFRQKDYGIIFDLDDTIVPTKFCHQKAKHCTERLLTDKYNLPEEVSKHIMERYEEIWNCGKRNLLFNKITYWEGRKKSLHTAIEEHIESSSIDANEVYKEYLKSHVTCIQFSADVKDLLQTLRKNFKLALLTDGDNSKKPILKALNVYDYFDTVVLSGDYNMKKPNPRLFKMVCSKLNLHNSKCIMVGDLRKKDILGSKQAGYKFSILVEGNDFEEEYFHIEPDYTIPNLTYLTNILKKCGILL